MIFYLTYSTVIGCEGGGQFTNLPHICFLCAFELFPFLMIFNLSYSTVICYEKGKFPVIDTMVSCVLLSYLTILMISDLSYSIVIFYEGGGQFPIINTGFMCAFEISFLLYDL